MIDKPCPWCNTAQTARVTRTDSGCVEWECSGCGKRWTVKDGHPGVAFVHWPGDLAPAFDDPKSIDVLQRPRPQPQLLGGLPPQRVEKTSN
jgi:hypothetical protein